MAAPAYRLAAGTEVWKLCSTHPCPSQAASSKTILKPRPAKYDAQGPTRKFASGQQHHRCPVMGPDSGQVPERLQPHTVPGSCVPGQRQGPPHQHRQQSEQPAAHPPVPARDQAMARCGCTPAHQRPKPETPQDMRTWASKTRATTSASAAARAARCTPTCSTTSVASRRPAVSSSVTGTPPT